MKKIIILARRTEVEAMLHEETAFALLSLKLNLLLNPYFPELSGLDGPWNLIRTKVFRETSCI